MLLLSFPFVLLTLITIPHFGNAAKFALNFNTHKNQTDNAMPVGTTSFIELISKGVFIDKTLLLTLLLKVPFNLDGFCFPSRLSHEPKHAIIVCPHNWGKTMNLQMLKTFLEIQVHPNGSRIELLTETPNYQLFTRGKYHTKDVHIELKKPLLISDQEYRPIIDSYLSQYPVIYLSFAGFSSTTKENHTAIAGKLIADMFHQHKYMLEVYDRIITDKRGGEKRSSSLSSAEDTKKKFLSHLQNTAENTIEALRFLCVELREHFGKGVMLLIDEYDRFFDIFFDSDGSQDRSSNFLDYTFATYTNSPIMAVFFTGVMPQEYPGHVFFFFISKRSPYPYYGFNEEEMKLLYEHYRVPPEEQKEIRHWYGGFNSMEDATGKIYNPYSVCKYFNSRQFIPHWEDADDHQLELNIMFKSNEFLSAFAPLIVGKSVEIKERLCTQKGCETSKEVMKEIINNLFRNISRKNFEIESNPFTEKGSRTIVMSNFNHAFDFLYNAGYLLREYRTHEFRGGIYVRYRIPNLETTTLLREFFDRSLPAPRKTVNRTSLMLETFVLGKSLQSPQLEQEIQSCFEDMRQQPKKESLFRLVLKLVMGSDKLNFINRRFIPDADKETVCPDIVLSSKTRGVIIDVSHRLAADKAIPLISRYLYLHEKYPRLHEWQDVKLVFLHLTSDNRIQVTSVILPVSLDKLNTTTVIPPENPSLNLTTVIS